MELRFVIVVVIIGILLLLLIVRSLIGKNVIVEEFQKGLLFSNGKFVRMLEPGLHWIWKLFANQNFRVEDMRLRSTVLTGQEILTKDQISLKISLIVQFKIQDLKKVILELEDMTAFLHQEAQVALREKISSRSLDELLAEKSALSDQLKEQLNRLVNKSGLSVELASIRDVILPAEIKAVLAKAIEADRTAKSALITAREELAAARTRANTAKTLEENPLILKLMELQALQEVAKKAGNTIVFSSADNILEKVVSSKANK